MTDDEAPQRSRKVPTKLSRSGRELAPVTYVKQDRAVTSRFSQIPLLLWLTVRELLNRLTRDARRASSALRPQAISIDDEDVPSFQRARVWSTRQQALLIDSLADELHAPSGSLVLYRETPERLLVPLDGQQRINALVRFCNGDLTIPNEPIYRNELRGKSMLDLPDELRERFLCYQLQLQIYGVVPKARAATWFLRLQAGTPITKPEARAALPCEAADFIGRITGTQRGADASHREKHRIFADLAERNFTEKKLRSLADLFLRTFLHMEERRRVKSTDVRGLSIHWEALRDMYIANDGKLPPTTAKKFPASLDRFASAVSSPNDPSGKFPRVLASRAYLLQGMYQLYLHLDVSHTLKKGSLAHFVAFIVGEMSNKPQHPLEKGKLKAGANLPTPERYREDLSALKYTIQGGGDVKDQVFRRFTALRNLFELYDNQRLPKRRGTPPHERDPQRTFDADTVEARLLTVDHRCERLDPKTGDRCPVKLKMSTSQQVRNFEAHHNIPHSDGGATTWQNLRLFCKTCHLAVHAGLPPNIHVAA